MRLNNFSSEAQDVMAQAERLAVQYRHAQLDVEHFLVALTAQSDGTASSLFDRMGVSRDAVRDELEVALRNRPQVDSAIDIYISSPLRHTIRDAAECAREMNDDFVGIQHLMLASVEQNRCGAADIAHRFGLTRDAILRAVADCNESR